MVSRWIVAISILMFGVVGVWLGFNLGRIYESFSVVRVVDGDTFVVKSLRDNRENRVRIWGVDAPELGACLGEVTKNFLESQLLNARPEFEMLGYDGFGRMVARVYVNQKDLALLILERGMAVVDDGTKMHVKAEMKPKGDDLINLKSAEEKAKTNRLGVWDETVACNQ